MGKIVTQHGKSIAVLAHKGTSKRIQVQIGEGLSARYVDLDPAQAQKLAAALLRGVESLEEKPRKKKPR